MSWSAPILSEPLHGTLTRALGAAQVAVKLDASNHDTNATVAAYQRCIALLDDVIRRGPESEEEVTRLKAIQTSYRDRVQVLLFSRSVPVAQQSVEMVQDPKSWSSKARRGTVKRIKALCGCMKDDGSGPSAG